MQRAAVIANPRVGAELGHLAPWFEARDFAVERLVRDDVLPLDAADDADLLVLLGSVWTMTRTMDSAGDPPRAAAAIAAEERIVRRRIGQDRPILGICFGGQLISHALGGRVTEQEDTFTAWEVPRTQIPELRAPWLLLHQDAFTVPPGAQTLASAEHAPVAFRRGRAWGLQFHPEVDADILARMFLDVGWPEERSSPYVEQARERAEANRADALRLFDRFWSEVSR